MSTALTPAKENSVALRQAFESKIEIFKTLAGGDENVMRLLFILQSSFNKIPGLSDCTQNSFLIGLMKCAELRLDPNTNNQCWILPFRDNDKGTTEAQWMPGYKGLEHLALLANPNIAKVRTALVYESEMKDFDLEEGSKPYIRHKPNFRAQSEADKGAIVLGYATAHFRDGETQFIWLPYEGEKESIMARARRSKTHKLNSNGESYWTGPWKTDPIAMMKKTLSLTLCKRALDTNARDPLGRAVAYDDDEGDGRKPGDFDPRFAIEAPKPSKAAVAVSMFSGTQNGSEAEVKQDRPVEAETKEVPTPALPQAKPAAQSDFFQPELKVGWPENWDTERERVPFKNGKNAGKSWSKLEGHMLQWIAENVDTDKFKASPAWMKANAVYELRYRFYEICKLIAANTPRVKAIYDAILEKSGGGVPDDQLYEAISSLKPKDEKKAEQVAPAQPAQDDLPF